MHWLQFIHRMYLFANGSIQFEFNQLKKMVGFLCSVSVRQRKQYDITCEEVIDIMHRNMYEACDPLKVVPHVE